tara:strand:+ start:120 stop:269 length:150 start_codon:yes stop_codon:yes gene_type:complete
MGALLGLLFGGYLVWWVSNKSNQLESDKKVDFVIGWLIIGVSLGYILFA